MMKKALVSTVLCAAAVLCALTGCGGSGKGTAKTVSGGYLPERIEQIQEGGMIPSGRGGCASDGRCRLPGRKPVW